MKAQTLTVIMGAFLLVLGQGFVSSPENAAQEQMEFPYTSGNAFSRLCSVLEREPKTHSDAENIYACIAFVHGVLDGVLTEIEYSQAVMNVKPPSPFCLPKEGVENGQMVKIVLKYIRNHPEQAHDSGSQMVLQGLMDAFPCN